MKTKAIKSISFATLPKSYNKLVAYYPPRPIKDETELDNAHNIVEALIGHKDITSEQEEYLHALSLFIEEYESVHHKTPSAPCEDVLRHLLDANGMNTTDLSKLLGLSLSMGSKILKGDRSLTVSHIQKLSARFRVEPNVFFG